MQLAVEIHVLQHFRPVRLERGAEIAQVQAGCFRHQPVGHPGRELAHDRIVHPVFAPAAGDVEAFVDLLQQRRNIFRSMLQIAIHGDDHVAFGFVETGRQGSGLAEVCGAAG